MAVKECKNFTETYTGREKSPLGRGYHPLGQKIGDKRKGKDGKKYAVVLRKGKQSWRKVKEKKDKKDKAHAFPPPSSEVPKKRVRTSRDNKDGKKKKDERVSNKIKMLIEEGKPRKQAIAIALAMKKNKRLDKDGNYIPKKRKTE